MVAYAVHKGVPKQRQMETIYDTEGWRKRYLERYFN